MKAKDWTLIDETIRLRYPTDGRKLANELGISLNSLYIRASKLGIRTKRLPLTEKHKNAIATGMKKVKKDIEWCQRLSESLKGKKHTPERLFRIAEGVSNSRKKPRGMTKPELRVADILNFMFGNNSPYEFTGNRSFWIVFSDGRPKNPDFTDKFHKKVIEVYGNYWHKDDDERNLIEKYAAVGWDCLVVWEDDFSGVRDRIMEFTYPYEFAHELQGLFECV